MNAERALYVIEGLMLAYMPDKANKLCNDMYRIAHTATGCRGEHTDWEKEALETEKELIEANIISEFPIHQISLEVGKLTTELRLKLFKKMRGDFCLSCGESKTLLEQMVNVKDVTVEGIKNGDEVQKGPTACDHQEESARAS